MDISRQYSEEALFSLFSNIDKRNDQILDIVQLLLMASDESAIKQDDILAKLADIKQTTIDISTKMDTVLERLTEIERDFSTLKAEQRDIEQKLTLMITKLSKLESSISDEDIDEYRVLAESLYSNWDALDVLTKRFIPLAEFLYSKLQKYEKADYSPVILELCRALENEFLLKIFRKYTLDLLRRKGKTLNTFLSKDRSDSFLTQKTSQFVKAVYKASKNNKPEYTLGQMYSILSMLNDDQVVYSSPLMRDFDEYLNNNTEAESLLDSGYMSKIDDIVNNFRNPSAHPEFLSIDKANKCREMMPDRLDYLMDCVS